MNILSTRPTPGAVRHKPTAVPLEQAKSEMGEPIDYLALETDRRGIQAGKVIAGITIGTATGLFAGSSQGYGGAGAGLFTGAALGSAGMYSVGSAAQAISQHPRASAAVGAVTGGLVGAGLGSSFGTTGLAVGGTVGAVAGFTGVYGLGKLGEAFAEHRTALTWTGAVLGGAAGAALGATPLSPTIALTMGAAGALGGVMWAAMAD